MAMLASRSTHVGASLTVGRGRRPPETGGPASSAPAAAVPAAGAGAASGGVATSGAGAIADAGAAGAGATTGAAVSMAVGSSRCAGALVRGGAGGGGTSSMGKSGSCTQHGRIKWAMANGDWQIRVTRIAKGPAWNLPHQLPWIADPDYFATSPPVAGRVRPQRQRQRHGLLWQRQPQAEVQCRLLVPAVSFAHCCVSPGS